MNLFETLKQFKAIQPDPAFSEKSKRAVLAVTPERASTRLIFRLVEAGLAVGLTGFFIFLITGGFSGSVLAPMQYSAVDPQSLRAEAQAIDMQIDLTNITYAESGAGASTMSTVSVSIPKTGTGVAAPVIPIKTILPATTTLPAATTTPASTSTVTIDQALKALSQ